MSERIKRITRRIKRVFVKDDDPRPPKKITASRVIRPEAAAELPARRRLPARRSPEKRISLCILRNGVTHVTFIGNGFTSPTVNVRDPITRRLSRRRLEGGIQKTVSYYDERGRLISDQ